MDDGRKVIAKMLEVARDRGLALRKDSAVLDESGWDFFVVRAVELDGTPWILRRARRAGMEQAVAAEARLLSLVGPHLPVPVPDWRTADSDLIAYPCSRASLPPQRIRVLMSCTGGSTVGSRRRLTSRDSGGSWRCCTACRPMSSRRRASRSATRAVRATFRERLEIGRSELSMHPTWQDRGQRWVEDDRLWSPRTVLIHGDLHPGHTLVDESGMITGVLDWTDAEIGDPGQEFIEAARKFDPPVWDALVASYQRHGGPAWPGLRQHVANGIAFAPLTLGVLGLTSDQPRYVEASRRRLSVPSD